MHSDGVIYVSYPMRTNASDMIILLIFKRDLDGNIYLIVCLNSMVCHVFMDYFASEKEKIPSDMKLWCF